MRKKWLVLALTLVLLLTAVAPVYAVTYGEPDGNAHPYVGLVLFYDAEGTPLWRCTGTLLSPTVFLTAGHCTDGAVSARVYFDPVITPSTGYPYSGGVTGTPYTHPDFVWQIPNTSDVGVVVLDEPVVMSTYGQLPEEGFLDSLATQRGRNGYPTFTVVGYGLQSVKPVESALRERYRGVVELVNLRSALTDGYNLHYTSNAGQGRGGPGGTCFGDSGGPVFYGDTTTIVAVNSFVLNENCKGAGFGYRVDIENSLSFINQFLD